MMWQKGHFAFVVFLPQTHNINHEGKKIRQTPIKGNSTKYMTSIPQNYHGHQKQVKCEDQSQPRGA